MNFVNIQDIISLISDKSLALDVAAIMAISRFNLYGVGVETLSGLTPKINYGNIGSITSPEVERKLWETFGVKLFPPPPYPTPKDWSPGTFIKKENSLRMLSKRSSNTLIKGKEVSSLNLTSSAIDSCINSIKLSFAK
jgi:hypothetical protein